MDAIVKSILPGSSASGTIIAPGDVLRKINGHAVADVLDYKYLSYDSRLLIELFGPGGKTKLVRIRKPEGADIGLEFDTFLMDRQRSCANKCIFCFIDQLPRGMRETLYYKDDDIRLSFLQGNYITLTNLSKRDIDRIIKLRISPVNISVHTLDPELRAIMLGVKDGASGVNALITLAEAGIVLNCQIVCCPGINDGDELERTMEGLYALGPGINSVSVVPVGLTKHRQGLFPLRPFDRGLALKTILQVGGIGERSLKRRGTRAFFCADELYIKAGLKLPPHWYYEQYPQLENGVGMMRLFITEFEEELAKVKDQGPGVRSQETGGGGQETGVADRKLARKGRETGDKTVRHARNDDDSSAFSVVTGVAAHKYLTNLLKIASEKHDRINGKIFVVRNDFFGESVTVSGLVTGGDLIGQLKDADLGSRLLIPQNMLRYGEDVFLDDVTIPEVSKALGVPVRVVPCNGADMLHAFMGEEQ